MSPPHNVDSVVARQQSLRATSIIGGAAILNVAFGLVRMKIAAIVLGPVGIGLIGLMQNLLNTAASIGGLNLGVAGARQIVASQGRSAATAAAARRALLLTTLSLAVCGGLAFWLFRQPLATLLFQDRRRAGEIGWLAVGVAATAAAGYQAAVLSAGRRIGDIAKLNLSSAAVAALIGSACVIIWNRHGILPFVLVTPVVTLVFGSVLVRRSDRPASRVVDEPLRPHVTKMLKLGAALTSSIFVSLCGQLAIRTLVERKLGAIALGHFQAAWTVTTVYLAFIFQTMASDYLPRLTAVVHDRSAAQKLMSSQAEVGFLLAAPILLAMIGGAPWALSLLYTSEFVEATALLRCQMLGDLVRLAIWPLTLVLLAEGASRQYAIVDIAGTAILVTLAAVLLPTFGLAAPGIAYLAMNLAVGAVIMLIVSRSYSIVPESRMKWMFAVLCASCVATLLIGFVSVSAGLFVGVGAAFLWAAWAFIHLGPSMAWRRSKAARIATPGSEFRKIDDD